MPAMAADFNSISALCTLLPQRTPQAVDYGQRHQRGGGDRSVAPPAARNFAEVSRERYGDRGHPTRLRHQEEHPSINERHRRVIGHAEVKIVPSGAGKSRG